ncbi:MAG TPA: hypothetical protein DDY68_04820 [Porphyromonadaceae bacterium]|nr:hypothetical protein [Porphyromonadaceae bacterium]
MAKEKKDSWKYILLINISLMLLIVIGIILFIPLELDKYTHHGEVIFVPSVVGLKTEDAEKVLSRKGLRCKIVDSVNIDDFPRGMIYAQDPKVNAKAKGGRFVFLTLNRREKPLVSCPKIEGGSKRQVEGDLMARGFRIGKRSYVPSAVEGSDLVLEASCNGKHLKEGDSIPQGSIIDLKISEVSTSRDSLPQNTQE